MVFAKGRRPWARRRGTVPRGFAARRESVSRSCHGLRASVEASRAGLCSRWPRPAQISAALSLPVKLRT